MPWSHGIDVCTFYLLFVHSLWRHIRVHLYIRSVGVSFQACSEMSPRSVLERPLVDFWGRKRSFHTVGLFDADAPSSLQPRYKLWVHWFLINVPGNDVSGQAYVFEFRRTTLLQKVKWWPFRENCHTNHWEKTWLTIIWHYSGFSYDWCF